ncbi:hypothetical protein C8R45DRAFT_826145 [Mycena sanguinolenta]|nr:hypothetical protein C8R45DRAFT_826145 [Mycena sanguinolenta]
MAFSPWKWDSKGYVAQGNTDDKPQSTRASPYNRALPDAAQSPATSRQPAASSDDPTASGGRKFLPVERHSGQKEGEDIQAFLARRTAQNLKWASTESSEAKAKRLARENHAMQGAPPGKKGARVFVWEEEDGFLIRRAVNRDNAADMWDEFTPNQRFGYDDLFPPDLEFAHLPDVPETPLPVEPIQEHSTSDDLLRVYRVDSEPSHVTDGYEPFVNMEEIPSSRFGFTAPLIPAQYGAPLRPDFYARSLGDEQWPRCNHVKYALLPVMLAYLATAKTLEEVPQELLDLRQDHSDICGLWAVIIEEKTLNGERFYLVRPRDASEDTQSPHILLKSAATALQIVRMGWESSQEIVFHLLLRGVEFRLCRQASLRLGVRPAGYKPTELDYLAYQTRRDDFLASHRGRAARFAGRIIGRLVRDIVLDDIACLGPSDKVFESGVRLWDGQSQTAYWDDDLTPEEIELICGVYHVETGMSESSISRWN